jgi:hypothetical protein
MRELLADLRELAARIGRLEEVDFLFGKSSVASTSIRSVITSSTSAWICRENAPSSERPAERAAASVLASIRSATASACARSSLSFRNARRVNSPGSASRSPKPRPASRQRCNSSCITIGPP